MEQTLTAPIRRLNDRRVGVEVTVLMPVRDGERWLPATLRCLRRLRGEDVEILVVDDGSRDRTLELLQAAAQADERMRVLRQDPMGLVAALNAGLEAAQGRYVARLDADDLAHPDRLRVQVDAARAHGWDVCASLVRCFPRATLSDGLVRYERWQNALVGHADMARERFVESPVVHPTVLFERRRVLDVGGYRDLGWPEDYDLWLRLFAAGARFGKVARVLTAWRDHPGRYTRQSACCAADAFRDCKAAHLQAGPLATAPGFWMAGTGRDAKRLAPRLVARGARLRGWLDINPRRLGQRIHGAPVLRAEDAPLRPGEVVLVAVGAEGRREEARRYFDGLGLRETADYWCVA
jgi:hypothetical protein